MILVIGERIYDPKMSNEKVYRWRRMWDKYGWEMAMRTPAMVYGSARKRLDSVLPGREWIVNLLPPDNMSGTWDDKLAQRIMLKCRSWVFGKRERTITGIILLGRRVAQTYQDYPFNGKLAFGEIEMISKIPIMVIPHPSLRNRGWNQEVVQEWVNEFMVARMLA